MPTLAPWFLAIAGCIPNLVTPGLDTDSGVEPWVPPENGWFQGEPPGDLRAEGFDVGEVVPDFRLADQHGQQVALWQFYGHVIVLDVSTMWCSPCRELAETAQETRDAYADQSVEYVTILVEDIEGENPDTSDLMTWVDYYGLEMPVVADVDKGYSGALVSNGQYPALVVIDRTMQVADVVATPTDAALRIAVDAVLADSGS